MPYVTYESNKDPNDPAEAILLGYEEVEDGEPIPVRLHIGESAELTKEQIVAFADRINFTGADVPAGVEDDVDEEPTEDLDSEFDDDVVLDTDSRDTQEVS